VTVGLFDQLVGGSDRHQEYQDFADRYDQGQPHEGYDDDEVSRRYAEVSGEIDPDTYRASAQQAFERMSPEDRSEFARQLHEQAGSEGFATGRSPDGGYENDPGSLADMTTRVHQQSPGLLGGLLGGGGGGGGGGLGGLLGGGGGGGLGGLLAGAGGGGGGGGGGLGGLLGGGGGGGNPLVKAAMAGITAFAAKQMMNRR